MASRGESATEAAIVSRDRAIEVLRRELRTALYVEKRFASVKEISTASGVSTRAITSYLANDTGERREAPLSSAMSLAVVLGQRSVNAILALIGYGGAEPLDEGDTSAETMVRVSDAICEVGMIAQAAARGGGRISHVDDPAVQEAADRAIHDLMPFSSAGRAE